MKKNYYWPALSGSRLLSKSYICGYCSNRVSSDKGYPLYRSDVPSNINSNEPGKSGGVYFCPQCFGPTYFYFEDQIPGPIVGSEIEHLDSSLAEIYNEIRKDISNSCNTSAVLLSRKLLMHIAVEQGASENLRFIDYVNYLVNEGFTPPNSKVWVDSIRKKGNEATHEIKIMTEKDATQLLIFLEMILKFIYSFPMMMKEEIDN